MGKDDVIVSLLADLQQEQDQESEKLVNEMQDKVSDFVKETKRGGKKRFSTEFVFRNPFQSFPFLTILFPFWYLTTS